MTLTGAATTAPFPTTYEGIGMEAVLNSESYFRYSASANGNGI